MDAILGIDFGTSKIATVLVDPSDGRLVRASSRTTEAYIPLKESYKREQDLLKIDDAFYTCIDELFSGLKVNVVSAGLTGQMHGILGVDCSGRPVTNFVTWQDGRGEHREDSGKTLLKEMEQRAGSRPLATGYGIVTLYDWVRKRVMHDLKYICTLPDYFGMTMTEKTAPVIDYTFADSLGCFDPANGEWDITYLEDLGIDAGYFPRVVPTGTIFGEIRENRLLKLMGNARISLCVALGDNQASFIGSVREFYTTLLVNIGTASQVTYAVRDFGEAQESGRIDGYDVVLRPFVENGFLVAGNALAGGAAYNVLYEFFKQVGRELFDVYEFDNLWERMARLAEKDTGAGDRGAWGTIFEDKGTGGMRVKPVFGGTRRDSTARGTIEGLDFTNFTPPNLIRATLRGIIEVLHDMLDKELLSRIERVVGSGNGMRKNRLLRKIASEIFGHRVLIPLNEEEAAIGAAVTGGVAAGVFKNFDEGKKCVRYID